MKVIEGIIAALKDEDKYGRKGAVIALGEIGDERAVESLIATLKDEDGDVRQAAVEALEKITGKNFGEDEAKWRDWLGEE